jgi:hypothetical protein
MSRPALFAAPDRRAIAGEERRATRQNIDLLSIKIAHLWCLVDFTMA